MRDHRRSRTLFSNEHSYNDDSTFSSDEEDHKDVVGHPLRQNPPSILEEDYNDIILAPSPALTFDDQPTCYSPRPPSPLEDIPQIPTRNGHHRSWTSTLKLPPFVAQTASRASLASPTKALAGFISSRDSPTVDSPPSPSKQRSNPLNDWFVGTSAPLQLGGSSPRRYSPSPTRSSEADEYSSSEMAEAYTSRPTRPRRSSTATSYTTGKNLTSKLSWLAKSITTASTAAIRPGSSSDSSDELLTLDVNHALLPHGTPDILAPSSFHDLLATSEALLLRYQAAYRNKCTTEAERAAEQSAQAEEVEEAETRARHLKMQLDDMAEKAKQQEEAMRCLSLELLAERRRREDEDLARRKSVQIVRTDKKDSGRRRGGTASSGASVESDSGFESDADSTIERASIGSSLGSSPTLAESEYVPERGRPTMARHLSTYDKVLKTVAGEPASAWAVMEGYREENRALRERVKDLEGAVDGCLDMVASLGV